MFQHLRPEVFSGKIGRELPQVVLPMTAQQGVELVFQVGNRESILRMSIVPHQRCLQPFNFSSLLRGKIAPAELMTCVAYSLQQVSKLAAGSLGGRCWIVQFMRQPSRKLAQSH